MSYREKTPIVVSILKRKLKPGKTFEDFQIAHLPGANAKKMNLVTRLIFWRANYRIEKLGDVCDNIGAPVIAFVASDNDYGGKGPEHQQAKLARVTPEMSQALKAMLNKDDD